MPFQVTAIIPTKGVEPFLEDLLLSVSEQRVPVEVLVVDAPPYANGDVVMPWVLSIDDEDFRVRYVRQTSGRKGSALNQAAELARSRTLLFLDADVWLPSGIVNEAMRTLDCVDIVSSKRVHEIMGWNVLAEPFLTWIRFPGPWFAMISKETFRHVNFDDHPVEDVTFWLKTRELGLSVGYTRTRVRLRRRVRNEWKKAIALWREVIRA